MVQCNFKILERINIEFQVHTVRATFVFTLRSFSGFANKAQWLVVAPWSVFREAGESQAAQVKGRLQQELVPSKASSIGRRDFFGKCGFYA